MPGDYNDDEIRAMDTVQFQQAKARNWRKTHDEPSFAQKPNAEINLGTSAPRSEEYGSSWGARKGEFDFTTPSGEKCLMRELKVDDLLQEGVLDKVSRLEGLADELIQRSEGAPPAAQRVPNAEEFAELLRVINTVTRLAVVKPTVVPDDFPEDDFKQGMVRVSWIDLEDRSAIMEHALRKLRAMDRFRNAG